MVIKKTLFTFLPILIATCTFFVFTGKSAAAGGSLSMQPATGSHVAGEVFTVALKADGGGTNFNAASATVVIPPILQIQSITLGDCGFAFVKTPTQTNISFAGVILGDSVSACTVYTLTVQAIQPGTGSITVVSGSIKSYKGAQEIFTSSQNAVYVIAGNGLTNNTTQPVVSPTQAPIIGVGGIKLYTIVFHVNPPAGTDPSTIQVVLDPNEVTQRKVSLTPESVQDPIIFDRVPQGVHTITTYVRATPISKQIVSVGGPNRQLIFGISAEKKEINWVWYALSILTALFLGITGATLYRELRRNSLQKSKLPS